MHLLMILLPSNFSTLLLREDHLPVHDNRWSTVHRHITAQCSKRGVNVHMRTYVHPLLTFRGVERNVRNGDSRNDCQCFRQARVGAITFTLVVDDVGGKYTREEDAKHLEAVIGKHCPIKSDWKEEKCIGIDLKWEHDKRQVTTSMKGYVKKALHQFQHDSPSKPVHSPSKFEPPRYGQKCS